MIPSLSGQAWPCARIGGTQKQGFPAFRNSSLMAAASNGGQTLRVPPGSMPKQPAQALQRYPVQRAVSRPDGLDLGDLKVAELPLLASALDSLEAASYSALHRSVKRWFGQAIWASDLAVQEKLDASCG